MPETALAAPGPDENPNGKKRRKSDKPKLRDGVIKRGSAWYYVIRVTDPETGVSKPRWVGGHATEDEAKAARDEARVKARRGEYVDRNAITLGEFLDEWIDGHSMMLKPKTCMDYRNVIRRYIKPRIGGLKLQAVQPAQITRFYGALRASGGQDARPLSARTVAYVHTVLHKALNDAVTVDRLISVNPASSAKRPRVEHCEPGKIWSAAQLRAFLATAEGHRLFAFFRLAAYSGARRGELLNLRWKDVDLSAPEILIRGSANVIDGKRVEGTTKSGRSRIVSLDAATAKILAAHKERQEEDAESLGDAWKGENELVFVTGWGEPIFPDTVSSLMGKLISQHNRQNAGNPLPRARLHDLRHLHATMLLLGGAAVHVVAARLGHADPAVTLRVYAHVINERLTAAVDIFAAQVEDGE